MKKLLSLDSVYFIRGAAETCDDELLQKMVSDQFAMQHCNCICLPMFWANKLLLSLILEEKIPLIIYLKALKEGAEDKYAVVKESCLYYGHGKNDGAAEFIEVPLSEIDVDQPAIVFEGVVIDEHSEKDLFEGSWKNAMRSQSMNDMILASAADHRQYPIAELDQFICSLNDQEYRYYTKLADRCGFSLKNPSLFFVRHIYTVLPKKCSFIHESVFV